MSDAEQLPVFPVTVAGGGRSFTATIRPGGHPPLNVTLLVPLPDRADAFADAYQAGDGAAKFTALTTYVSEHVLRWDATDASGNPVPIAAASFDRIPAAYTTGIATELNAAVAAVERYMRPMQDARSEFVARMFGGCFAGALRKAADRIDEAVRSQDAGTGASAAFGVAADALRQMADGVQPAA